MAITHTHNEMSHGQILCVNHLVIPARLQLLLLLLLQTFNLVIVRLE